MFLDKLSCGPWYHIKCPPNAIIGLYRQIYLLGDQIWQYTPAGGSAGHL